MFRAGVLDALESIEQNQARQAAIEESRQRQARLAAEEARLREHQQMQMQEYARLNELRTHSGNALAEMMKQMQLQNAPMEGPQPVQVAPGQASVPMMQPGEGMAPPMSVGASSFAPIPGMPPDMMPQGALPPGAQGPPAALSANWVPSDAAAPELGGRLNIPPPVQFPAGSTAARLSGPPTPEQIAFIKSQGGADIPGLEQAGAPVAPPAAEAPKSPEEVFKKALETTQLPGAARPGKLPPQWLSVPGALQAMEKAGVPADKRLGVMSMMLPIIQAQNKEEFQDFKFSMGLAAHLLKVQDEEIKRYKAETGRTVATQGKPGETERLTQLVNNPDTPPAVVADARARLAKLSNITQKEEPGSALTPDAVDIAAAQYLKTGTLPQMWRDPESKKTILNRAGEMQREAGGAAGDVPGERAGFKSDTASLTQLTKRYDALEQSAKKIDKDIATLNKYLDSGTAGSVTLINKPLNYLRTQFSDPKLNELVVAAKIVGVEYERMITGGLLSIAQLHEGAREDAQKLLNENMTPDQIRAVLPVMMQEINNQRTSFKGQIGEVKDRLRGPKGAKEERDTAPSGGSDTSLRTQVEAAGQIYEPDKYEYRVVNGKVQRRAK